MQTNGINHTGLSVRNLDDTARFFTRVLGWEESGRDEIYPRTSVSDGVSRLTLWQVADDRPPAAVIQPLLGHHDAVWHVADPVNIGCGQHHAELRDRRLAEADAVVPALDTATASKQLTLVQNLPEDIARICERRRSGEMDESIREVFSEHGCGLEAF